MIWIAIAIGCMVFATLAVHLGLMDAAADVLRKVLICHQCFSFWLTLSVLTIAGCCLPCALLLAIFIAYASNWFSLILIFLTKKYDNLWRRVNRKNRPNK